MSDPTGQDLLISETHASLSHVYGKVEATSWLCSVCSPTHSLSSLCCLFPGCLSQDPTPVLIRVSQHTCVCACRDRCPREKQMALVCSVQY